MLGRVVPESRKVNPVVEEAQSNLLLEGHIEGVAGIEIPIVQDITEGRAALAALLRGGGRIAQRSVVADGGAAEVLAELQGIGEELWQGCGIGSALAGGQDRRDGIV